MPRRQPHVNEVLTSTDTLRFCCCDSQTGILKISLRDFLLSRCALKSIKYILQKGLMKMCVAYVAF